MHLKSSDRMPLGPIIIVAGAAASALLGLYYYVIPLTGVTGAPGVLLVIGSSLALVVDGFVLWFVGRGAMFWVFWTFGLLGMLGTTTAAFFLHAWWLLAAMMVVPVGLTATIATHARSKEVTA